MKQYEKLLFFLIFFIGKTAIEKEINVVMRRHFCRFLVVWFQFTTLVNELSVNAVGAPCVWISVQT
jgi:hypothetical protein